MQQGAQYKGIAGFVRTLTRAPKAQQRLVLAIMAAMTGAGVAAALLLEGNPIMLGGFGAILSVLPAYLVLARGARPGKSYSLFLPEAPPPSPSYREAGTLTVEALVKSLERHGYRLEVSLLDSEGRAAGAAGSSTALRGPALELREASARRGTGAVALRLPPGAGIGTLDVTDTPRGLYDELARFAVVAVGELVRGTTFKETFSSLSPESTDWMQAQLPDRPLRLV